MNKKTTGSVVLATSCWVLACGGTDDAGPVELGSAGTVDTAGNGALGGSGVATGGAATAGATTGGATTAGADTGGATTGGSDTAGADPGGATTAGADPGGNGSCFPPIDDYSVNDGGLGSAEREMVEIGNGDSVSIFRPSDANFGQNGCQHPLLVWGNGSSNTVDIWAGHLSRASTYGFVLVAPEQTQVNAGHMDAALDYVIELSQDSNSEYYNKIDTSKLGATGYSLGGAGAMSIAANDRIGATFIWDSFGNCGALNGPMGGIFAESGIGGGFDLSSCPPLSFAMTAAGTSHTSVLTFPGGGFGGFGGGGSAPYAQEGYVAWYRWHFMGDPAAEALFVGADCGFCTRDGITAEMIQ